MKIRLLYQLFICVIFYCISSGDYSWKNAKSNQFPFIVHVYGIKNGTGVIVHPSRVLTAGHVVTDLCEPNEISPKKIIVIGGTEKILVNDFSGKQQNGMQIRNAEKVDIDPNYYGGVENDISVLTLSEPFETNDNIAVAHLPKSYRSLRQNYPSCDFIVWARNTINSSLTLEFINIEAYQNKRKCDCILDKFLMDRVLCISPLASRLSCEKNINGGILFCDGKVTGLLLPYEVSCYYDTGDLMAPDVCASSKHNQSSYNIFSKINHHEEWVSLKSHIMIIDKGPSVHAIKLFQSILISLFSLVNKL